MSAGMYVVGGVVDGVLSFRSPRLMSAKEAITAVGGKYNALYATINDHYTNRTQFGYDRMTLDYEQLTKLNGAFFPASGMGNPNTGFVVSNMPQITKATVITDIDILSTTKEDSMLLYGYCMEVTAQSSRGVPCLVR